MRDYRIRYFPRTVDSPERSLELRAYNRDEAMQWVEVRGPRAAALGEDSASPKKSSPKMESNMITLYIQSQKIPISSLRLAAPIILG
jgi:hypothetical protein